MRVLVEKLGQNQVFVVVVSDRDNELCIKLFIDTWDDLCFRLGLGQDSFVKILSDFVYRKGVDAFEKVLFIFLKEFFIEEKLLFVRLQHGRESDGVEEGTKGFAVC